MLYLVIFIVFVIGCLLGGLSTYAGIKEYRKQLGFSPDPFERSTIYTKDSFDESVETEISKMINYVQEWSRHNEVTQKSLNEYLIELRKEIVGSKVK